ncbi:MAG TPA: hypothetical protein PKD76_01655 [Solirubrobacterales bacterium]|nr:hypothetical protein [Solirubrobacterales bacterium]
MLRSITGAFVAVAIAVFMLAGSQTASAADNVNISGRAFIFNHMSTGISNATIKVREFPTLSAMTNELGDYTLEVPDDANVTPYIVSGQGLLTQRNMDGQPTGSMEAHWNEIDLQTFHTRGEDIENANFQAPRDEEYGLLKIILNVPARADGRPEQCAIVTTSSARNVRDVDFRTYWLNTPHGVAGATSEEFPSIEGPVYFNDQVVPDVNRTSSSKDGGIIWPIVPTGTYRIVTSSPTARFASFLATCAPGRIINANPPMGAYELSPGESARTFSNVAGSLDSVKVKRQGKRKRSVTLSINAGEALGLDVKIRRAGKVIASRKVKSVTSPRSMTFAINPKVKPGKLKVSAKLTDASGVSYTDVRNAKLPKIAGGNKKK